MLIKSLSYKWIYKFIRYKDTHFRIKNQMSTRISLKSWIFFIDQKGFAWLQVTLSPENQIDGGGSSREYGGWYAYVLFGKKWTPTYFGNSFLTNGRRRGSPPCLNNDCVREEYSKMYHSTDRNIALPHTVLYWDGCQGSSRGGIEMRDESWRRLRRQFRAIGWHDTRSWTRVWERTSDRNKASAFFTGCWWSCIAGKAGRASHMRWISLLFRCSTSMSRTERGIRKACGIFVFLRCEFVTM